MDARLRPSRSPMRRGGHTKVGQATGPTHMTIWLLACGQNSPRQVVPVLHREPKNSRLKRGCATDKGTGIATTIVLHGLGLWEHAPLVGLPHPGPCPESSSLQGKSPLPSKGTPTSGLGSSARTATRDTLFTGIYIVGLKGGPVHWQRQAQHRCTGGV